MEKIRLVINDYIGTCIYTTLRTDLSHKPNFINYPFREEMVGDGLENAIKCISNFDPSKSSKSVCLLSRR